MPHYHPERIDLHRLEAIQQRLQGITPGPWRVDVFGESVGPVDAHGAIRPMFDMVMHPQPTPLQDAEFVAHSREDMQWLAETVLALKSQNEQMRADAEFGASARENERQLLGQIHALEMENASLKSDALYGQKAKAEINKRNQRIQVLEHAYNLMHRTLSFYANGDNWRHRESDMRVFNAATNSWQRSFWHIWQGEGEGPNLAQSVLNTLCSVLPKQASR